mgnify:CR=1 FL=1
MPPLPLPARHSPFGRGFRRPNAGDRLLKAADLMEQRAPDFIDVGVLETGATRVWCGFNAKLAAGMLREAASMTTQLSGEVIPSDVPGNMALAMRQPCGVVLGIAPWNAPVILGTRAVAMPLACGNTVVLKASEICPAVHRLIGTVLQDGRARRRRGQRRSSTRRADAALDRRAADCQSAPCDE